MTLASGYFSQIAIEHGPGRKKLVDPLPHLMKDDAHHADGKTGSSQGDV